MKKESPVAIGGIGGSGTRVVAELVKRVGVFVGDNLNASNDNLSFPDLRRLYLKEMSEEKRADLFRLEIRGFDAGMHRALERYSDNRFLRWGWKVPTTFLYLHYFSEHYPGLQYIHVIRNGLDMAFSSNQNQLHKWGFRFGVTTENQPLQKASLLYWLRANQEAVAQGEKLLKGNFMLLRFESLCANPKEQIKALIAFLGLERNVSEIGELSRLVMPPETIGRYRYQDLTVFDTSDLEGVREFGFPVS